MDDAPPPDKKAREGYGLHFIWRQIGGKFEVHQSDRNRNNEACVYHAKQLSFS